MKNEYKIIVVLIVALSLSGCTSMKEVDLVTKDQLIEKQFEKIKYDEKEAYIAPNSSYVTVIKDDKIIEAFLTESNVFMFNDESGIYVSNGANLKLYSDKCFIDNEEFQIKSEECEKSVMGNDINGYLKSVMPDLLK